LTCADADFGISSGFGFVSSSGEFTITFVLCDLTGVVEDVKVVEVVGTRGEFEVAIGDAGNDVCCAIAVGVIVVSFSAPSLPQSSP
jgi:hypothetical protein